jgi:hypothetical protein
MFSNHAGQSNIKLFCVRKNTMAQHSLSNRQAA